MFSSWKQKRCSIFHISVLNGEFSFLFKRPFWITGWDGPRIWCLRLTGRSRRGQELEYRLPSVPQGCVCGPAGSKRPGSCSRRSPARSRPQLPTHKPSELAKRQDRWLCALTPQEPGLSSCAGHPRGAGMARGQYREGTLVPPFPLVNPFLPHCLPCSPPSLLAFSAAQWPWKSARDARCSWRRQHVERTVFFRSFSFRFHSAAASVWRGQEMFHTCLLSPSGGTKQGLVRAGSTEQRVRAWAGRAGVHVGRGADVRARIVFASHRVCTARWGQSTFAFRWVLMPGAQAPAEHSMQGSALPGRQWGCRV